MSNAGAIWQHHGLHHWHAFPAAINDAVDKAFQCSSPSIQFQIKQRSYTLDLINLKQWQDSDPSKARKVRRLDPSALVNSQGGTQGKWQHSLVTDSDEWQDFPGDVNVLVDQAYAMGAAGARYRIRGAEYVIHFQEMMQSCTTSSKVRKVRRLGGSCVTRSLDSFLSWPNGAPVGLDKIPMSWTPMGPATYREVELLGEPSYSLEFESVVHFFKKSLQKLPQILSVKRLQNTSLWQQYAKHRQDVMNRSHNAGVMNEEYLWHGSRTNANQLIKHGGFDVSKGQGLTWLSTNSQYSVGYCHQGLMFLVRATLGHIGVDCSHCGGNSGHVRRDDQVGGGSDNRYTFSCNSQMYPAYIIQFQL